MMRRGFTLVEMLLATVLSALLLGGVLMATAALARDAARLRSAQPAAPNRAMDLLRWDLTNAATMFASDDGRSLTLAGQCALDRTTLSATGRLARVIYRVDPAKHLLTREQRYLDDDIRPEPWVEIVACDVTRIEITGEQGSQGFVPIPPRVAISIARESGTISAEVRTR